MKPEKGEDGELVIACGSHGSLRWRGEVMCTRREGGCGRVWRLKVPDQCPPGELGNKCLCGAELTADGPAIPICARCFEPRWSVQSTKALLDLN